MSATDDGSFSKSCSPSYVGILIDFGIEVQHGWIQPDDIILPYTVRFLAVQLKQEVILGVAQGQGGTGQTQGFINDAACNQKERGHCVNTTQTQLKEIIHCGISS